MRVNTVSHPRHVHTARFLVRGSLPRRSLAQRTKHDAPGLRRGQPPRQLEQEGGLSHPWVSPEHDHAPWYQATAEDAGQFRSRQGHPLLPLGCTERRREERTGVERKEEEEGAGGA